MAAMNGARLGPDGLAEFVRTQASGADRYLLGIAGPPGSGKSTLAAELGRSLDATVVPMDGFHLPNAELDRRGVRNVKGAPATFDAVGFVAAMAALRRAADEVLLPTFDRGADEPVPGMIRVAGTERIVIVEGNYLLLDRPPWVELRDVFDAIAYVDLDHATRLHRLIARHVEFGRSLADATAFVHESDEANTALVEASRADADVFVDVD